VSEYFFERPKLLERNHPQLYDLLKRVFKQDMSSRKLSENIVKIGRNSPTFRFEGLKTIFSTQRKYTQKERSIGQWLLSQWIYLSI